MDWASAADIEVYDVIVDGLLSLEMPDWVNLFTPDQIAFAMAHAFTFDGPRLDWLTWLCGEVEVGSKGDVVLADADPTEFPQLLKTPGTAYLKVVGESLSQLVAIGPFNPPMQFF